MKKLLGKILVIIIIVGASRIKAQDNPLFRVGAAVTNTALTSLVYDQVLGNNKTEQVDKIKIIIAAISSAISLKFGLAPGLVAGCVPLVIIKLSSQILHLLQERAKNQRAEVERQKAEKAALKECESIEKEYKDKDKECDSECDRYWKYYKACNDVADDNPYVSSSYCAREGREWHECYSRCMPRWLSSKHEQCGRAFNK